MKNGSILLKMEPKKENDNLEQDHESSSVQKSKPIHKNKKTMGENLDSNKQEK